MAGQVSIKEAARRLGVTPKEIRRRIKNGELAGFVQLPGGGDAPAPSTDTVLDGASAPDATRDAASAASSASARDQRDRDSQGVPDSRDVEIERLQSLVTVLRDELEARRREVQELHVLLREQQRTMLTAAFGPALPRPATEPTDETPTDPSAGTREEPSTARRDPVETMASAASPTAVRMPPQDAAKPNGRGGKALLADAGDDEVLIDWQAYDAESEHLRHTMGRLQELLEELERATPEEPTDGVGVGRQPDGADSGADAVARAQGTNPPPATAQEETPPAKAPTVDSASAEPRATPIDPPTGAELAHRREAMGLSRELVAASTGLSWGFVTEVERGRRKDTRSRQRLADALDALKSSRNRS